jgi:hypothetical protein
MRHVVLLGDSVFDNGAYVGGGPDVAAQLREALPAWRTTLLAVDGSTVSDVPGQLAGLPPDASHLVISAGGNDALGHAAVLDAPSRSVAESLAALADIGAAFRTKYAAMLAAALARALPLAICTIYDPRFPDPLLRRVGTAALALVNDGIVREAVARALPILDLRAVCDDDADFANPIEPSVAGGAKIAAAIAALVSTHDFGWAGGAILYG